MVPQSPSCAAPSLDPNQALWIIVLTHILIRLLTYRTRLSSFRPVWVPSLKKNTHTMDSKTFCTLTWNVNGLHARFTDLHSYVFLHKPDIIALLEVETQVPELWGYTSYIFSCVDDSSRGMVLPIPSSFSCVCVCVCVCVLSLYV